ncbi:EVE domain-containing protein [Palleronia sp. LCG004]|uniref:EVE domain-containing protein n=1 Tax=Palleronia sp. LCG004 TaxID=3079304 RepID=UPI002943E701|nr:EVE domain-containing protein [Palleronia sp. LCG004]WOI55913.1 EVE domain-containing protein [Palleronia sp. LCG004]
MRYWLFKSEPSDWSWDDQVAKGDRAEEWTGVRNYQARNMMREMEMGDLGFFYHSQKERAIVGIVEVTQAAHPDPSAGDDDRWDCVSVRAVRSLPRPVTLDQVKADARLAEMALVRAPRLSVQPVDAEAWRAILELGGLDGGDHFS